MIFAIENFSKPFCGGIDVADGGGDTDDACTFAVIIVLLADSMIGLFDINGTPIGLHGCIPLEICLRLTRRRKENSLISIDKS